MTVKTEIQSLREKIAGPVVAPDELGWEEARQAWNLAVDQRPAAVAYATSVADVIATVELARASGLRIAAQGTGHGAGSLGPLDDVVLLKTVRMAGVEMDASARTARVEAGALWGDVAVRAGEHGLAALAGSSSDVGVVGYTLGGGLGWLGRRYGLASNSVLAIELVTADGQLVRVDHDHEPDLFWALRGGGGSFGVVTALELQLHPVAEVFAGMLTWPAEQGAELLERYRVWAPTLPEDLTSVIRYLNIPPLPEIPEPMRGRSVLTLDAAYLGGTRDGEELMRPLRGAGSALMDTFDTIPAADLRRLHGDPEQPSPALSDGCLLGDLTPDAAEAFVGVAGPGSGSPLTVLELRHLGGALANPPDGHGALGSLDGDYALVGVGSLMDPESARAMGAHLDKVLQAMRPWSAERRFLNFSERLADPAAGFPPETYRRLREVKRRYDAENLFRSNQPIPPAD